MSEGENLKNLHKALLNFNKRAERASSEILVSNFVDSEPLFDLLSTPNNQVIYGRRGTGKTHALKYLAESVEGSGDHVYIWIFALLDLTVLSTMMALVHLQIAPRPLSLTF